MPIAIGRSSFAPAPPSSLNALKQGSQGELVSTLQEMLAKAGFDPRGFDGQFGPKTAAAVRRFQTMRGLSPDGIVGVETWAALSAANVSKTIRPGDAGTEVRRLQKMLERAGFDPDGVDGQYGSKTQQAVVAFQRRARLDVDGVVGTDTWRALNENAASAALSPPAPPPQVSAPRAQVLTRSPQQVTPIPMGLRDDGLFRENILKIAAGEVGTVERTDRNDGEVLKYPRAFGRGSEKWCADFTSWVLTQAGGEMDDPYTPSVVNELKIRGLWKSPGEDPEPGDLVLFDWNDDNIADHIGIVEGVNDDGSIATIEGNTENPDTGREGVWRRDRDLSTVLGFGTPF